MVRLEKIIYEQLINTRQLKRERLLSRPQKWYNEPRTPALQVAGIRLFTQGLTGSLFKMVEPLFSRFVYNWMRDFAMQRGLALEDTLNFQDRELRRDPFYETIVRQGFHPYQWLMYAKRRARYYKVERAVRGSYAPEWAQEEASQRTLADAAINKFEWDDYVYKNYMSEITPMPRNTVLQKVILIEIFSIYGLFRVEAWDRFFYNEVYYNGSQYSKNELETVKHPMCNLNLQTEEGRRQFEIQVKRFIDLYPGAVVRDGESFDFERFYALEAIKNGRDLSKFDTKVIKALKTELEGVIEQKSSKGKKSKQSIPSWLSGEFGKGILSQ